MIRRLGAMAFGVGLLALWLPGSDIASSLFVPFLDFGARTPWANPWAVFPPHHFPYGSLLYGLLVIPRILGHAVVGEAALGQTPLSFALLKLPLLALDLWLLRLLIGLAPHRRRAIVLFYWLNPVLFYITYAHTQLDIAATTFLLASLVAVTRERHPSAAALMAAALLCKAHVLIVLPVVAAYIWKRDFLRPAVWHLAQWAAIVGGLCGLGLWPHWRAGALGYVVASSPEALQVFSAQLGVGGDQIIYLGVAVLLAVLGRLCTATMMTEMGLIFGVGCLLGVLTLVTRSMPGWYFWSGPLLALLYATYATPPRLLWAAFGTLYFVAIVAPPWVRAAMPPLVSANLFTMMQTAFAGLIAAMWHATVRVEAPLHGRMRPLLIGIAGDSASGKDTLTAAVAAVFDPRQTAIVAGDDYHKWERGHARWQDYTHLNPRANHLAALAEHTAHLTDGRLVFQPHYDHSSGTFSAPRTVRGSRLVIVQGLHTLYLRNMRGRLDLKVFLAPHPLIRLAWKLARDVGVRGHSVETVLRSFDARQADAEAHIAPQRAVADWIVDILPAEPVTRDDILAGTVPDFSVRHTVWNDVPVIELAAALRAVPGGCAAVAAACTQDMSRVTLEVRGEPTAAAIAAVAAELFPRLRTLTRCPHAPRWEAGPRGVHQLLAVAQLEQEGLRGSLRAA